MADDLFDKVNVKDELNIIMRETVEANRLLKNSDGDALFAKYSLTVEKRVVALERLVRLLVNDFLERNGRPGLPY